MKTMQRAVGINESPPCGSPRAYRLLHARRFHGYTPCLGLGQDLSTDILCPISDTVPYHGKIKHKKFTSIYIPNTVCRHNTDEIIYRAAFSCLKHRYREHLWKLRANQWKQPNIRVLILWGGRVFGRWRFGCQSRTSTNIEQRQFTTLCISLEPKGHGTCKHACRSERP